MNPGVLPDTCVAYCDSTIAFPLFSEYVVGHRNGRRKRKGLVHERADLLAALENQARRRTRAAGSAAKSTKKR